MLDFILKMMMHLFAEVIVRVLFGWGSKMERSLGIINIVAFCTVLYCIYQTYYVTAGLFFSVMLVVLYFKLRTAANIGAKHP